MPLSSRSILVDAGPLIALGNPADRHHADALEFARTQTGPLVSTWPVITEAAYFLGSGKRKLFQRIRYGAIVIAELTADDMPRLVAFIDKYPQADFADASLVLAAERTGCLTVATTDRTDFAVYRTRAGGRFRNVFGPN